MNQEVTNLSRNTMEYLPNCFEMMCFRMNMMVILA